MSDIDVSLADLELEDVEFKNLPKEFFPDCWQDDVRMAALFSPFRVKSLNPLNYESKLSFWNNLISKYCQYKGSSIVSIVELRCAFKRANKKPYCLQTVFEEMEKSGKLKMTTKFLKPTQHTWRGWAQQLATTAVTLPLTVVVDRIWKPTAKTTYIILDVVKSQAEKLQKAYESNNVLKLDELLNDSDSELSTDGIEMALHYLQSIKKAEVKYIMISDKRVGIVKIAPINETVTPINDFEIAVFDLNESIKLQTLKVENYETEINSLDEKVRQYIRDKKKILAKTHLKKKHIVELNLEKCSKVLDNLQSMLGKIMDSKHNSQILETYRIAANTLKQSYEDSGITPETVDDVLDDVKDVIQDHEDVQAIVGDFDATNTSTSSGLDEASLEAELKELLQEEEKKIERELDESIERRLHELNPGFGDLSVNEKQRFLELSIASLPKTTPLKASPSV